MELDHVPGLLSRQDLRGEFAPRSLRERLKLRQAARFVLGWTIMGIAFNLAQRVLDMAFAQVSWLKWLL